MASYTTNLNLKKPAGGENVLIGDINGNMDTIDAKVGGVTMGTTATTLTGAIAELSDQIGNLGKLLRTDRIDTTTTSVTVEGLSNYSVFIAQMTSSWSSGVAIGFRYSTTSIRFVGISSASGGANVTSTMSITTSGDTITSVSASFGTSATGITNLTGIL